MGDKTKIDELFSEGLKDFEASPQGDSWARISATLDEKPLKKRGAYWRWISLTTAVILAFYTGYYVSESQHPDDRTLEKNLPKTVAPDNDYTHSVDSGYKNMPVTNAEDSKIVTTDKDLNGKEPQSTNPKNQTKPASSPAFAEADQHSTSAQNSERRGKPASVAQHQSVSDADIASANLPNETKSPDETIKNDPSDEKPVFAQESTTPSKDSTALASQDEETYADDNKKPVINHSSFTIGIAASPTFPFTDVVMKSNDANTADNVKQEKPQISFSYGLVLACRLNPKFEIQTGVLQNSWKQTASQIKLRVSPSSVTSANTSLDATGNTSSGNINFNGLNDPSKQGQLQTEVIGGETYSIIPELKEHYTFIDIPLTAGYYIIDKPSWFVKTNLGLNFRFMTQSEVTLVYADGSKAPYNGMDLEKFSMQLGAGAGAGIKLGSHWQFSLSPTLLYGISRVNTHNEVDTYFHQMLIYSTLSYRF